MTYRVEMSLMSLLKINLFCGDLVKPDTDILH